MRPMERRSHVRPAPVADELAGLRRHRPDYWLVAICALLLCIGLVVVFAIGPALAASANVSSSYYVNRQLLAIALSAIAFIITARIPLGRWKDFRKPLLILAAGATLLALIMPVNPHYPAHRWVRFGSLSFQSVELLKFAVLIWLAGLLSSRMADGSINHMSKTFKPLLIALALIGGVVAGIQSDLGSTGVMLAMMGVMVYVAGLPMKRVLLIGAVVAIGTLLAIVSTPYRRERLQTYLHPSTSNCAEQVGGYQACRAIVAVGSGGIIGLGLGSSVQAYGYLPEAANDSIFAIYAEKFGFIGSMLLLVIFGILFSKMASIAERAPNSFSKLLVVGILTWFSVQAMINIGAMIGLLPLKGITLPFISYGGTSVVFAAAAVGIVFNISHYTSLRAQRAQKGTSHDDRYDGRRLRGAYHPDLGSRA